MVCRNQLTGRRMLIRGVSSGCVCHHDLISSALRTEFAASEPGHGQERKQCDAIFDHALQVAVAEALTTAVQQHALLSGDVAECLLPLAVDCVRSKDKSEEVK